MTNRSRNAASESAASNSRARAMASFIYLSRLLRASANRLRIVGRGGPFDDVPFLLQRLRPDERADSPRRLQIPRQAWKEGDVNCVVRPPAVVAKQDLHPILAV